MREQEKLTARINEIQQELDRNENLSAQEKIKLYQRQLALRNQIVASSEKALQDNQVYQKVLKSGAAEIINGELFIDMEKIKKNNILSDLELSQLDDSLDDIKSHISTVYEGTYEIAKNLAQAYIDEQVDATQAIIDELDKRKEAYEDYFDELDSLEEEEERSTNKDSIVQQIEALTGALDSSSKLKIKDLQQQLKDLQDEELDAQRQKQRDAITASLDKQTEKLNDNITNLNNSLSELTEQLVKNTNAKTGAINIT